MSAHTPGPWNVTQATGAIHAVRAVVDGGKYGPVICDVGFGATHEINVANANLIASAPDLLAALIAMDDAFCSQNSTRDERHQSRLALIAARAAIAKATGVAP